MIDRITKKMAQKKHWLRRWLYRSLWRETAVAGQVTRVNGKEIEGWAIDRRGSGPARVQLFIDDVAINTTTATRPLRLYGLKLRRRKRVGFRFAMDEIWPLIPKGAELSVRVGEISLPFVDGSITYAANVEGLDGAETSERTDNIKDLVSRGFLINKKGRVQKPAEANAKWAKRIMPFYSRLNTFLEEEFGYQAFVFYGILLGYAREGGLMSHDLDLDIAYLSRESEPEAVRQEFYQVMERAISVFERARPYTYKLQFPGHGMSLIPCWFYGEEFANTFAYVGDGYRVVREDIEPLQQVELFNVKLLLPNNPQNVARYLYGRGWAYPDRGWTWDRAYKKRRSTKLARLSRDEVNELELLRERRWSKRN